ncbi:MAG: hypothetical protein U0271_45280 [Polyangiaceae bacterium]
MQLLSGVEGSGVEGPRVLLEADADARSSTDWVDLVLVLVGFAPGVVEQAESDIATKAVRSKDESRTLQCTTQRSANRGIFFSKLGQQKVAMTRQ